MFQYAGIHSENSPRQQFFHMSIAIIRVKAPGETLLLRNLGYSTQGRQPPPTSLQLETSMHQCNYGQTSPICMQRPKHKPAHELDRCKHINTSHSLKHMKAHTPREWCNGMLINAKPCCSEADGLRMSSTGLTGTLLFHFLYTFSHISYSVFPSV